MRPVVDLPQPNSPTSASVSPGATSKVRPSTARTVPTALWKTMPRFTGKCLVRPETERSGSLMTRRLPEAKARAAPSSRRRDGLA